jgi:hypothetical protein
MKGHSEKKSGLQCIQTPKVQYKIRPWGGR